MNAFDRRLPHSCWRRSDRVGDWSGPEDVSTSSFSSAEAPTDGPEVQCSPEQVGFEVDGAPEPDAEASGSFCARFEVVDECPTVDHEASVASNPDLEAAEFVEVGAEEAEADQVIVVPQGEDPSGGVGLVVSGPRQPAETMTIEAARRVAEREDVSGDIVVELVG